MSDQQTTEIVVKSEIDKQLKSIAETIFEATGNIKLQLPVYDNGTFYSPDDLAQYMRDLQTLREVAGLRLGYAGIALKLTTNHGEYLAKLAAAGLPERAVQQQITVIQMILAIDDRYRPLIKSIPFRKQRVLARLAPNEVVAAIESGELAHPEELPLEDLQELVREKKKNRALEKKIQDQAEELARKEQALQELKQKELPPELVQVKRLRLAALEETENLRAITTQLQRIIEGVQLLPETITDADLDSIVSPTMFNLRACAAQALMLLEQGKEIFGDMGAPENLLIIDRSLEEIDWAEEALSRARHDLERRESMREGKIAAEQTRRGRGRPKKGA